MDLTERQELVWEFCAKAVGRGEPPTVDEIRVQLRMGKNPAEHAVKALIKAKLFTRDRMRRLEFTADGLDRAKRRGWVKRTASEERAQIAEYVEFWMGRMASAEDLRTAVHWEPEVMAHIEAEKAKARGTKARSDAR
jgi:hypothetical protein